MSNDIKQIEELEAQLEALKSALKTSQIPFIDIKSNNQPKGTKENFQQLLNHYSISIKYNEMTKEPEINIPGFAGHNDIAMNAKIAEIISYANKHSFPTAHIDGFITQIAADNAYHPVRDWIDSITWDGVDRMQEFVDTVVLRTENELKFTIMRKWSLSAVAALYHPNFSCEGVLTFTSGQGVGKTSYIFGMLPKEHSGVWIKDGVTLDMNNKDTIMKALSHWITELGELDATFKKSDIEALKAFITERTDVLRPPYERKANKYARRTVFYASVNDLEFLKDNENRRFWVLEVERFLFPSFDIGQFWAQVKQEYMAIRNLIATAEDRAKNNEWGWFMSPDERKLLSKTQERFKTVNFIDGLLSNRVVLAADARTGHKKKLNVTAILQECGVLSPNQSQMNQAGKWLREAGYHTDRLKKYEVEMVEDVEEHTASQKRLNKFKVNF